MEKLKPNLCRDDVRPQTAPSTTSLTMQTNSKTQMTAKVAEPAKESLSKSKAVKPASSNSSSKKIFLKCMECESEFDDSKAYQKHLLLDHKCFSCEFCSKTFASLFLMMKHKDQEHAAPKSSSPSLPDAFAALSMSNIVVAGESTAAPSISISTTSATASGTTESTTKMTISSTSNHSTTTTGTTPSKAKKSGKSTPKNDKHKNRKDESENEDNDDGEGAEEEEIRTKLKCGVCEETLFSKSSLEKHFQTAHGALADKFYRCSDCNAVFLSKDFVKTHRKKEHGAESPVKAGASAASFSAGWC